MIIKAPDVPGPTAQLCWKQAPTMGRCDRRKGHGGPCAWEAVEQLRELLAALKDLRALVRGEMGECVDVYRADTAIAKAEGR